MKKVLFATIVALSMPTLSSAADLAVRMPLKAAAVAPAFSWSGCYVGGFVGGAANAGDTVTTDRNGFDGRVGFAWGYKTETSVIGGGTLGCNWQPSASHIVLGIEGEGGYLKMSGSAWDPLSGARGYSTTKVGDWYGMITGRAGYSFDRTLVYAKGGAAFVDVSNGIGDNFGFHGGPAFLVSTSTTKATWAAGGGVEWAFDPSWSVKAEYMYIGLNNTQSVSVVRGGTTYNWDTKNDGIHTAKIGLNYRFLGL